MIGRRLPTMLLGGFALLAMLLACAGIYGVLSFVTAKRTQELGIRAALGASRWDLVRMVVGGGAMPGDRRHRASASAARCGWRDSSSRCCSRPARRRAQADRRRRAVPHRRAGRVLRAGVARVAHRPDGGAASGMTPLVRVPGDWRWSAASLLNYVLRTFQMRLRHSAGPVL